jgi:cation:H+ antiporter
VTRLAEPLTQRFGLGEAFVGMLLLGGITSLPEVATVGSSAYRGDAALAVNNVFGSIAINLLLLACADLVLGRRALTSTAASASTLLQGVLSILLLAVAATAVVVGDVTVFGVGVWSAVLLAGCIFAFAVSSGYAERAPWSVPEASGSRAESPPQADNAEMSTVVLCATLGVLAAVVLGAGYVLSEMADGIAAATGIGSGLVGLVLVAFATSLPELSTMFTGIRRGRNELVVGDIFGTNVFNMLLIVIADVTYRRGAVLDEMGPFETVAALLGIAMTATFVVGLLERGDRRVLRMGYDSAAAIGIYIGGVALLWPLQR